MNIRALIFDLDGTLLNSEGQLGDLTVKVVEHLSQQGLTLVYATGRSPFMASLVQGLPPAHFLCNNGAQIYHPDACAGGQFSPQPQHLLDQQVLPTGVSQQIISLARSHRLHLECNYGTHTAYEYIDLQRVKKYGNPILELNAEQVNWDQTDLSHCIKFATMGEEEELAPFTQDLRLSLPGQLHTAYSYHGYLELTHPTLNKRERIGKLFALLGCTFSETMAFGDGLNDLEILQASAVGVLMSNAHPKLQQRGNELYLAPHHNREGVAQFLRSWFHLS